MILNESIKNTKISSGVNFAFFGTDSFATGVLNTLKEKGFLPKVIVTTEDKPKGRNLILTPCEVKMWAIENKIEHIEPKTLKSEGFLEKIKSFGEFDVFIVASYGKIIPKNILELPKFKTLNVHPSLLPKLRGPSPIQSAILTEKESGVTIMVLDEQVDHGPILTQEKLHMKWPPYQEELARESAESGGKLLLEILPKWLNGEIKEVEQDHTKATFTKKFEKVDAEINLDDKPEINLRKIRAFDSSPNAYFFKEINGIKKRILVKGAYIKGGELIIEKVIPEGKKEMGYQDFLRGLK